MALEPFGFVQDRRFPPDDPREWLNRARSNFVRAKEGINIEGVYLEDLCFDAQQAAEKAIKALLINLGVRFPYTHDLAELLTIVEQTGLVVPGRVKEAARLSDYAVETRYPGLFEPITSEEYEEAMAIAEEVVLCFHLNFVLLLPQCLISRKIHVSFTPISCTNRSNDGILLDTRGEVACERKALTRS